jgi:hypothetical protein
VGLPEIRFLLRLREKDCRHPDRDAQYPRTHIGSMQEGSCQHNTDCGQAGFVT